MGADSVLTELISLEPIFHSTDGPSRSWFDDATAEDFWEVGASGRAYDREEVWAVLAERTLAGVPPDWRSSDFRLRPLGADTYLLTYLMHQGPRVTRRATIWERRDGAWRVVYHQGTVVADSAV